MARIAFLTERLPPHPDPIAEISYNLILQLADQQHDIRVYSTYREGDEIPPSHPRIQILRPFKKWGWREIPRLLTLLLEFQPEILHVIDPHAEATGGMTGALTALPTFFALLNHPRLVVSFFDVNRARLHGIASLLRNARLLTVMNLAQARVLRETCEELRIPVREDFADPTASTGASTESGPEAKGKAERPVAKIMLLPAAAHGGRDGSVQNGAAGSHHEMPDIVIFEADPLSQFFETHSQVILIPGDLDLHPRLQELITVLSEILLSYPQAGILFGGGWGTIGAARRRELMSTFESHQVGARVFITGPLDGDGERRCLTAAHLAFVATLLDESLGLTRILQRSLQTQTVMILNHEQARQDALPWKDLETALITGMSTEEWKDRLQSALSQPETLDSIRAALIEFARDQTFDQPGNIMSRRYAELVERSERR